MKTPLKLLIIPVMSQLLMCSTAFAKKDKSIDGEDSKKKREERASGGQLTPPGQPERTKNNKADKSGQGFSGNTPQDKPKKQKSESTKKQKDSQPKPEVAPPEPKKKVSQPEVEKKPKKTGDNKEGVTERKPKKEKEAKETDTDKKSDNNDGSKKKDKEAGNNDKHPSDTAANHKDKDKPEKREKPLDLPGKRPNVPNTAKATPSDRHTQDQHPVTGSIKKQGGDKKIASKPVVRPGQNTRAIRRPELEKNTTNNWWSSNKKVTNNTKNVKITNNTTIINRNFQKNVNWTTGRRNWGYNPWWNRTQVRPWYGSSWNGSWNRDYYHRTYYYGYNRGYRPPGYVSVRSSIGWGLIGWSLGTLIYDTGYHTYYNPYTVRTRVAYRGSYYDYSRPITRVAVDTAPESDEVLAENTRQSESIIAESQTAFKQRNYLVALELADKAIAETPGDGALHEYRALVLFALGKYGDAAGVLNPVLASSPGWSWSTMVALYDNQSTYTDQLQSLEAYSEANADQADSHFLLGYHYMVCGHTDLATTQFDLAVKLMPADTVSKQLASLTRSSANSEEEEAAPTEDEAPAETPEAEPVPLDKLTGTWTSKRDDGSTITLTFKDDGKFSWSYVSNGKTSEFAGDYSMNDDGLLVLDSDQSQMVASVALPQDAEMNFVLAGGPPEDSGLTFNKG